MSDFSITTENTGAPVDTRWRASAHGQTVAQPGVLDLSKFVSGTHYNIGGRTDNVIPSGVAVTLNATTGMYEPWVEDQVTPLTVDGYVNDNSGVQVKRADGTTAVKGAFARLLHGFVDAQYLPVAGQRTAVKSATHSVQISYL